MRTVLTRLTAGTVAAVFIVGSIAVAQNVEEVKIEAKRVINAKTIGHMTGGGNIIEFTLSYGVSFADLDLASASAAAELEKRVKDAARSACEEIGSKYPDAKPSDAECAQKAAAEAMRKVHKLVAAAQKAAGNK